jgi:hypothetical protein
MNNLNEILDSVGTIGSMERLKYIANLDLGIRSESAKKVVQKRELVKSYMDKGLSHEESIIVVKSIFNKNQ